MPGSPRPTRREMLVRTAMAQLPQIPEAGPMKVVEIAAGIAVVMVVAMETKSAAPPNLRPLIPALGPRRSS